MESNQFEHILKSKIPILDVRAPIEFREGAIPGSVNIPILSDSEREQVGTTYKKIGSEAAIQLGHQLVSGAVKEERVQKWIQFLSQHQTSVLMCFRGGLRSKTAQIWCLEKGLSRGRIEGGYKAFRQYLIDNLNEKSIRSSLTVIGGTTGAAKTWLLRDLSPYRSILDLELHALHRGSAFGAMGSYQPSQAQFENELSVQFFQLFLQDFEKQRILIEDESRMIGSVVQPESLFENLRQSPLVMIEEPLSQRTENTYQEYILNSDLRLHDLEKGIFVFQKYKKALQNISKKLGGLRYQEVLKDMEYSEKRFRDILELDSNRIWIEKLLKWYYDPLYLSSLEKRNPKILFKGNRMEVFEFLKSRSDQIS